MTKPNKTERTIKNDSIKRACHTCQRRYPLKSKKLISTDHKMYFSLFPGSFGFLTASMTRQTMIRKRWTGAPVMSSLILKGTNENSYPGQVVRWSETPNPSRRWKASIACITTALSVGVLCRWMARFRTILDANGRSPKMALLYRTVSSVGPMGWPKSCMLRSRWLALMAITMTAISIPNFNPASFRFFMSQAINQITSGVNKT